MRVWFWLVQVCGDCGQIWQSSIFSCVCRWFYFTLDNSSAWRVAFHSPNLNKANTALCAFSTAESSVPIDTFCRRYHVLPALSVRKEHRRKDL